MDGRVMLTAVRLSIGEAELIGLIGAAAACWRWPEQIGGGAACQQGCGHEAGDRLQSGGAGIAQGSDPEQEISDQRGHDLDGDGISAGADEMADGEVLLEPFEEQLDLPAVLVERGDLLGGSVEIVGEQRDLPAGVDFDADQADVAVVRIAALAGEPIGQPDDAVEQDMLAEDVEFLDQAGRRVLLEARNEAALRRRKTRPEGKVVVALVEDIIPSPNDRHGWAQSRKPM